MRKVDRETGNGNRRRETGKWRPETGDRRTDIGNRRREDEDQKPETGN
jgi:hypothetical protein